MTAWPVLGNRPIEKLEDNLWHVAGAIPDMPLERKMVVIKLGDGSLLVHNGICLPDGQQRELDAWGPVKYVIVPNGWHRIDGPRYAARYPDARVLCPVPARKRVAKVVRVDGDYASLPADPVLEVQTLEGSSVGEAVFIVRSGTRVTLVFNDTVFNQPHLPGLFGFVYKLIGSSGGPKVTRLLKLLAVGNAKLLRAHLERLAETPGLHRVIPGHGDNVEGERASRDLLHAVAATL